MHPLKKAHIAHLKANKILIKNLNKYTDFAYIFSYKLVVKFHKHTRINNHAIELIVYQQPSYSSIYRLGLIELETLKIYIENNLANNFIKPFKFFIRVFMFLDKKPDKSPRLYINYQGFNNLTIKIVISYFWSENHWID